jgi:shikimate kinase
MALVLVTGMSGTGKSSALRVLASHGHRVVDADGDAWSVWAKDDLGEDDWIWREDRMTRLLDEHRAGHLFIAGSASNQRRFYRRLDHVVLLSAPAAVLVDRVTHRTNNPYGKSPEEQALILRYLREVEPVLRSTSTAEIDATAPLHDVVRRLEAIAESPSTMPRGS